MTIQELEKKAKIIRADIIKMLCEAKSGHPGGSLSATDLMVALYFEKLKHNPKNPDWVDRDRVIFSKGHVCPLLYACLAESGYFPTAELITLRKLGSRLQGHPGRNKGLPGIELSTGSLGQGLSAGVGMALGFKLDKKSNRVYVLMGDGELQEGSIWEAAMSAAHYKLDNLCGIVDVNRLQIDGNVQDVMNVEPLPEKWRAFGFNVIEIDGHSMEQILSGYDKASQTKCQPSVIIAHTVKGKGVSFMENQAGWHGKTPNKEQAEAALKELL
ncbi:MAG: transketolase [Elusimicrobiota bacterium]